MSQPPDARPEELLSSQDEALVNDESRELVLQEVRRTQNEIRSVEAELVRLDVELAALKRKSQQQLDEVAKLRRLENDLANIIEERKFAEVRMVEQRKFVEAQLQEVNTLRANVTGQCQQNHRRGLEFVTEFAESMTPYCRNLNIHAEVFDDDELQSPEEIKRRIADMEAQTAELLKVHQEVMEALDDSENGKSTDARPSEADVNELLKRFCQTAKNIAEMRLFKIEDIHDRLTSERVFELADLKETGDVASPKK